jgi:hypothetical protein
MLSHRLRHRAGSRRLVAALSAAVVVVATSVLFLSAPPASAVPAPPDIQVRIDNAVAKATEALQDFECSSMLNPPVGSGFTFTAREVLATYKPDFEPNPPPLFADAAASVNDFGRNSKITFYPKFARLGTQDTPTTVLGLPFGGRPEIDPTFDGDLQRAVAVLHEVGHLTGVEPAHEGRTDDLGNPLSATEEAGFYNTRILNVCFNPTYLIAGASCQQVLHYPDPYAPVAFSSIDCFATCRQDAGPVVLAWTSSLQSTINTDTAVNEDTGARFCASTRVSDCPPPSGAVVFPPGFVREYLFPPTDITLTITDASGHVSQDTFRVRCTDPNPNYGW